MTLGDLSSEHVSAILVLNNEHVLETSLLDEAGLEDVLGLAFYARGIDQVRRRFFWRWITLRPMRILCHPDNQAIQFLR
jgi:hypothetical protein